MPFRGLLLLILSLLFFQVTQAQEAVKEIQIKAFGGLQFDVVRFSVKPGTKIRIVFTNDDDMDHNLVITKPRMREKIVGAALELGEKGPEMNYVPVSDAILWSTPVVRPHQAEAIEFIAPAQTGVYPYVCTYPGHGFIMFGAMYVDTPMPELAADKNIPEPRRISENAGKTSDHSNHHAAPQPPAHPYALKAPYLYRILMPDASPASIAVTLPGDVSYCWDASPCRLRYAWSGGFIDNTKRWSIKGDAQAKVLGDIFYRDETPYPIQIGKAANPPVIAFKGYKLLKNYPEFHYTIDGNDVYELIKENPQRKGLIRTFRIPQARAVVTFTKDPDDGMTYKSSAGTWKGDVLTIPAASARQFTISMTKK